ncbi:MAG TPA: hypothetical protein VIV60_04320 [Polyangiaceae bacterium]
MARHTAHRIAPRHATVKLGGIGIAAHPTLGMPLDSAERSRANPARNVALVAARRRMATQARRRPRARFDRMPHQKITDMLELPFHTVGLSAFEQEAATLVVTIRTPGLGMARLADLGLTRRGNAVSLKPRSVVPQERLRQEPRQLFANVARTAIATFEVALVAFEALAHGR